MRRTLALITLLAAPVAATAGTVEVRFIDPDKFTDARDDAHRREDVLKTLEERFKQLGQNKLPASQTLQVDVLDVDLAGDAFPRTSLRETRVLRGRADWPRMHLRYTLREGDKVIKSGDDHLADMNYLMGSLRASQDGSLPYEKRMLDQWFDARFGATAAH